MRWSGILVMLLLVGLVVGCAASSSAVGKSPRMTVDQEVIDFGRVKFEQWARPVFQIRNDGEGDLRIQRASLKTIEGC